MSLASKCMQVSLERLESKCMHVSLGSKFMQLYAIVIRIIGIKEYISVTGFKVYASFVRQLGSKCKQVSLGSKCMQVSLSSKCMQVSLKQLGSKCMQMSLDSKVYASVTGFKVYASVIRMTRIKVYANMQVSLGSKCMQVSLERLGSKCMQVCKCHWVQSVCKCH